MSEEDIELKNQQLRAKAKAAMAAFGPKEKEI